MFNKCKITVIKKELNKELVETYLKNPGAMQICNKIELKQEFIVLNPYEMPEGLCPSAWSDIKAYIIAIASGGTFEFMKDEKSILCSCTDLFRPVYFKIERID